MTLKDRVYLAGPAGQKLRMAQEARRPEIVRAHYDLADLHLDRAYPKDVAFEHGDPCCRDVSAADHG